MFNISVYRMSVKRAEDKRKANELAAMQLVIECVHPLNLGMLPPSPRVLLNKAWLLGLI